MKIEDRIKRMNEFCMNPYIELENKTNFECLFTSSIKDFGRDYSMIDYPNFKHVKRQEVNIEDMRKKRHILFWTGGKESLLTSKILDYYNIKYIKVTFVESTKGDIDFSGGTAAFLEDGRLVTDVIKKSSCVADLASNTWGASVPILYRYILDIIKDYPDCVVWIGSEYTSCLARYKIKFALDQSDLLFHEINSDNDVFGEVYSIVNCLREFDIFQIVRKEFGYDPEYSCYNQGKKKIERIGIWDSYLNLLDKINAAADKDFIRMELNHIPLGIRLHMPIIYDFRKNITQFLRTLKSFDRYISDRG